MVSAGLDTIPSPTPFLTARWRDLVLLNYEVPVELVQPLVPQGTELDRYDGRVLASLVAFRFLDTRILGRAVPFHRNFDEVNLRFYVRRDVGQGEVRRAVVFVRELVPKRAVAWIARLIYNEPYRRAPIGHHMEPGPDDSPVTISYEWSWEGGRYSVSGRLAGPPAPLERPSEAEFITEHFWGYTRQRDGGTLEYRVAHPSWNVADLGEAEFRGDLGRLYGPEWAEALKGPPRSALYADGSAVEVFRGKRL